MPRGLAKAARIAAIAALLIVAAWFVLAVRPFQQPPGTVRAPVERQSSMSSAPGSPYRSTTDTHLTIPVTGIGFAQLVDTFEQARASGARRHDAIDIMAPGGSPVVAAAAGRVEKLFWSHDGGNTVYLRSRDGRRIYYYAHLDRYAPGLAEGQSLRQGAPIGFVGATGNADPAAPHLHFAIWSTTPARKWSEDATPLNPYGLLRPR
jgi:murein DD-endopeptidase MepM/ murein hydrolase activator NlpD